MARVILVLVLAAFNGPVAPEPDGEEIFNRVCATCHTIDPPGPQADMPLAPPMRMIVSRYLAVHSSYPATADALDAWLKEPAAKQHPGRGTAEDG